MIIEVRELLGAVLALNCPPARVGWPDDPTPVKVAEPARLAASFDAAVRAFEQLRPGASTLVCVEVNATRKEVGVGVLRTGNCQERGGEVEAPLMAPFAALRATAKRDGGELYYWGGNNHFGLSLPYPDADREDFPDVRHLPWDEQYRDLLKRESWPSLRHRVFRFANLAAGLAERCVACRMNAVLVPSVGLCIDPWLFASRGLTVTATDISSTALAALSEPGLYPRLYSTTAYERWDISMCASYAMMPHHDHFEGMPALEVAAVREALRERISFKAADWTRLPIPSGTIDLVFAANAVPRGSDKERQAVFKEWVRVLRPDGVVYIAQHHPGPGWDIESFFEEAGLRPINFLAGENTPETLGKRFQVRYSSG